MTEAGKKAIAGKVQVRVDRNTVIYIGPEDNEVEKVKDFKKNLKLSSEIW